MASDSKSAERQEMLEMIAKEIESYKEHGFIWPPLTTADINHNRLLLGEAPWSDIDLRPKERRRP